MIYLNTKAYKASIEAIIPTITHQAKGFTVSTSKMFQKLDYFAPMSPL